MPIQILPEYGQGAVGGVCFVCKAARRTDHNERVVDFWVDVEDLKWPTLTDIPGIGAEMASGQLQICESCVREAGHELGMIDSGTADQLHAALQAARFELKNAQDKQKLAENALKAATDYRTIRNA